MNRQQIHRDYLRLALQQAQIRRGFCAPNPAVGAVVVDGQGHLLAQGYHLGCGYAHAEVDALAACADLDLQDATVYVTLEPCCHQGRTPPCTDLLIRRQVKRVIFAYLDPNPQVAGQGQRLLQAAGVDCQHIPLDAIDDFYRSYTHWQQQGTPWVTVKLALSADEKIAGPNGETVVITGQHAQQFTHTQRQKADAILSTAQTVIADNPQLNVRLESAYRKPLYLLDSELRTPLTAKIWATCEAVTIFHAEQACPQRLKMLRQHGADCRCIASDAQGLDLSAVLTSIGHDGVHDLWVEAGGRCSQALWAVGGVRTLYMYQSEKYLGEQALPAFREGLNYQTLCQQATQVHCASLGDDRMSCLQFGVAKMNKPFISVDAAIEHIRQGKMVILVDDEDRENEGDLVMAAEKITPEAVNFMVTHARGLVCLPLAADTVDRLGLSMMTGNNGSKHETAFTVSIEAAHGITTGISAYDRAHTIRTAVADQSCAADIVNPGHIFPLRAKEGGVLFRSGHTEGSVDLAELAGLKPAAVICEIMREDGAMARLPDLDIFSKQHDIPMLTINDLIAYRMQREYLIKEVAVSSMPTRYGDFQIKVFRNTVDGSEHVVMQHGDIDPEQSCLVRVHSECLTGDAFGSQRCDCGWQLDSSLKTLSEQGGVLLYMSQEGRGIGLGNKIKAYALQDQGMDTVEANHHLGFSDDHRDYGIGSQILRYLGIRKMRLLTNNPRKIHGIQGYGLDIVGREPIEMQPNEYNESYLKTKREKLGHLLNEVK
jgi:3,4-dihydroxy 2-butanone 4-phosphate synthase/GTP cyclohydrolase II